jgi:hypothetical protein
VSLLPQQLILKDSNPVDAAWPIRFRACSSVEVAFMVYAKKSFLSDVSVRFFAQMLEEEDPIRNVA